MRALSAITLISLLFVFGAAPVEAVVAGPGNISTELLKEFSPPSSLPPVSNLTCVVEAGCGLSAVVDIPTVLEPIDPTEAVGRSVAGATGGLIHPACVAETARRAAMKPPQPPPMGDFPCIVPASNGAGIVDGVCFVKVCKGIASTGLDGLLSALGGISSLGSIVSGILGKLMQSSSQPSNENNAAIPQAAEAPPSTSALITTGAYQSLDMTKLFNDSAVIVRDLLSAMNP